MTRKIFQNMKKNFLSVVSNEDFPSFLLFFLRLRLRRFFFFLDDYSHTNTLNHTKRKLLMMNEKVFHLDVCELETCELGLGLASQLDHIRSKEKMLNGIIFVELN